MIKFLIPDALFRFQTEQSAAEKRLLFVGLGKVVGQDQSPARHQCPEYFLIQRKLFRLGEMVQRFHRNHRVIALFPKGDVKVGALYKCSYAVKKQKQTDSNHCYSEARGTWQKCS